MSAGAKIIIRNSDGDHVQLADFVGREGWEVTQNAEEGSTGISTLYMDDLDESVWDQLGYNTGANRQIQIRDYGTDKIVQFGYVRRRMIRRRFSEYGSPVGRAWSIEIADPNVILQRRILHHKDAKRPRETDIERIEWLVGSLEWDIVNQFLIGTGDHTMSKADYRGQTTGDVVTDCAQQSGKNYWIDIADTGDGDHLTFWYGKDSRDIYYSDLSISNDLDDLDVAALSAGTDTLVYPPANDTEYEMDPTRIFTGVYGTWEKGAVYRHSSVEDIQFARWDTAMSWPNIHEKDRAIERALKMIDRLSDEAERITSAIVVPADQAHLVRSGMRIAVKLTHIPRLVDYTDCRILQRGLSPVNNGARYRIPLVLEPIEATEVVAPGSCSTALSTIISAAKTEQAYAAGAFSMSITPSTGVPTMVIGAAIAANHNVPVDKNMVISSGGTSIYDNDASDGFHPTFAIAYHHVASPAGATTFSGTYTGGHGPSTDSQWATVMAAVQTATTTPVQTVSGSTTSSGSGGVLTFGSAPTVGNMIILVIGFRDYDTYPLPDGVALVPDDGLWTAITSGEAEGNDTGIRPFDTIQMYARCVASGDGSDYGYTGLSKLGRISAVELAIT